MFVPYEIAIKLKEKRFVEPCIGWWYNPTGNDPDLFLVEYGEAEDNNSVELDSEQEDMKDVVNWKQICEERKHSCSAPLWEQVIDWFRDKHQIEILLSGITVYGIRKYYICLYYNVDGIMTDHAMLLFDEETREYAGYQTFTYPEARQAAIEHALTLI